MPTPPFSQSARLRELFARLYPGRGEARRVVADAGIDSVRIDFSGPAKTLWFRIIEEAEKVGGVDALLARARQEYPDAVEEAGLAETSSRQPAGPSDPRRRFDVFLSHSSRVKPLVHQLADALEARGLHPWLDERELTPGRAWQEALEEVIESVPSAAVLVGPDGLGPWHEVEMRACLSAYVDHRRPVIPVLLPGAPENPELPLFLRGLTWVDLRAGLSDEGLDRLEWGIRGEKPIDGAGAPPTTSRIALVAVASELAAASAAVAERLATAPGATIVGPLDAEQPAIGSELSDADLVIVLLGGATGGTSVLADALAGSPAPLVLRAERPDIDRLDLDELRVTRELRRRAAEAGVPAFSTPGEAADLALDAVLAWMRERTRAAPGTGLLLETWERSYLTLRLPQWERGRYGPLVARAHGQQLDRAKLYVPLRTDTSLVWQDASGELVVAGPEPEQREPRQTTEREVSEGREERTAVTLERALSALPLPHLVIEGEAGAGKTVLLQHTAMVLAAVLTGETPPRHLLDVVALRGERPLLPVPVLLEARTLATGLRETDGVAGLHRVLQKELADVSGEEVPIEHVRAGLEEGRYLLLIDSLDETPGQGARQAVVGLLQGYAGLPHRSRVVLTTRPSAYLGGVTFGAPLRSVRIAPLGDDEVDALVGNWCLAQGCDDPYRERLRQVIAELQHRFQAANLAENPLLLTCTLLVYSQQERLPDSTAVLYQRMVDILCERKQEGMRPEERRQMLELVSLALQRSGGTELPVDDAARYLQEGRTGRFETVDTARRALDRLADDTGLIRFRHGRDAGDRPAVLVTPWHRSFQEYLSACRLAASDDSVTDTTAELFAARGKKPPVVEDPAWEGVLRFLVGVHGQRALERAHAYVDRLHDGITGSRRPGRLLGLVASGLAEYGELFGESHPLRQRVPTEIVDVFAMSGPSWPLADRLLALDALGRVGDPRLGDVPWVDIAGGRFEIGGDETAWSPAPKHRVDLSPFRIAWRLVTVADFEPFVIEGYDDAWWSAGRHGDDGRAPREWERQLHHPSRPVTGVSWFAAVAFCRWATATGAGPWAAKGWKVDLPTESEWKLAARGQSGDSYPWGKEEPGTGDEARANYSFRGSPGHPTPVGAFPTGNRGRLSDLAGNVWEWCRDDWRDSDDPSWRRNDSLTDPCHHSDGGSPRVVRGGSWSLVPWILRAAYRGRLDPRLRDRNVGFRVVCRRFPEHAGG